MELAATSRLPAIYNGRDFVEAGGLMSYAANFTEMWRRAAAYVDKILRGAKPADLPVEQPTKFEFVINLKTAKQRIVTVVLGCGVLEMWRPSRSRLFFDTCTQSNACRWYEGCCPLSVRELFPKRDPNKTDDRSIKLPN